MCLAALLCLTKQVAVMLLEPIAVVHPCKLTAPLRGFHFAADTFQDVLALRYCLCSVSRALALELAKVQPGALTLHMRRALFLTFSQWTSEGAIPGDAFACSQGRTHLSQQLPALH